MPEPAKCISACAIADRIYVVGGTLKKVLQFDIATQMWSLGIRLNHERASCGLTLCSGKVCNDL